MSDETQEQPAMEPEAEPQPEPETEPVKTETITESSVRKAQRSSGSPKAKPKKKLQPKAVPSKRPSSSPSAAKLPKAKKLTLLDVAAKVIAGLKQPISAADLWKKIEDRGLWKSPKGKTPHMTLSTAILREVGAVEPRFKRAGDGKYLPSK